MAQNLSIKCEKYEWNNDVELSEVNFLSSAGKNYRGEIDFTQFVLRKSNPTFSYQKEDIDEKSGASGLKLFGSFNSITLDLSNIANQPLIEFFKFFETAGNTRIRYKVTAFIDTQLIFQGVLSPDCIEYFQPSKIEDRETLSVTIYSWEKEFQEYYTNKDMLGEEAFIWDTETFYFDFMTMSTFLRTSFDLRPETPGLPHYAPNLIFDKGINNDASLKDWNIVKEPTIDMPEDVHENYKNFWWFMNGYSHIKRNYNLTRFEFLKKLCNAMGWVFHCKYMGNNVMFILRNRITNDSFLGSRSFNYSDIISYSVSYSQFNQNIETVKLPVLEVKGGRYPFFDKHYVKGGRDFVVSSKSVGEPSKDLLHFGKAEYDEENPLGENNWVLTPTVGKKSKLEYKDDYIHKYTDYTGENFATGSVFQYSTPQLLAIDGGDNDWYIATKKKFNLVFGTTYGSDYHDGESVGDYDMIYIGNFGTMMFRKNGSYDDVTRYTTMQYNDYMIQRNYIGSAQFYKNISALLSRSSNLIVECEVKGFYPYPDEIISFINCPAPFTFNFEILSLEADYISNTTKYQLRKR
jgi:hypothetical protein